MLFYGPVIIAPDHLGFLHFFHRWQITIIYHLGQVPWNNTFTSHIHMKAAARKSPSSSGKGWDTNSLHPWRFLRPAWSKPWLTWSDLVADPGLGRKLDWKSPDVPSSPNEPVNLRAMITKIWREQNHLHCISQPHGRGWSNSPTFSTSERWDDCLQQYHQDQR